MDVAAFDRAGAGVFVEAVILGVKIEQGGVFAAALRHGQGGENGAPGRGLRRISSVDLVGKLGLGHGVMDRYAGGGQGAFQLMVLGKPAFGVCGCARGQGGMGDGVRIDPMIVRGRAEQDVL